jgi:hypothetical protein
LTSGYSIKTATTVGVETLAASIIAVNNDTGEKTQTVSGADGYYEMMHLEAGIYWVLCIKQRYKIGVKRAEVKSDETTAVDFQLMPR